MNITFGNAPSNEEEEKKTATGMEGLILGPFAPAEIRKEAKDHLTNPFSIPIQPTAATEAVKSGMALVFSDQLKVPAAEQEEVMEEVETYEEMITSKMQAEVSIDQYDFAMKVARMQRRSTKTKKRKSTSNPVYREMQAKINIFLNHKDELIKDLTYGPKMNATTANALNALLSEEVNKLRKEIAFNQGLDPKEQQKLQNYLSHNLRD